MRYKASEGLIIYLSKELNVKNEILEEAIAVSYNEFYEKYLDELDNYFRYFYNIIKFIDKSQVDEKLRYTELLQAQLSKYELCLIYYNALGDVGKPKLYPLLEKYNFLENINPAILFKKGDIHLRLYPTTTFRFLTAEEKIERIIYAIQNNTDRIDENSSELIHKYYFLKYNCNEYLKGEILRRLK